MPDLFIRFGGRREDVRIGTALALSILVHAAALAVLMPHVAGRPPWPGPELGASEGLEVELATRAATPAASPAPAQAPAARGAQRASAPARSVPNATAPAARTTVAQGTQTETQGARQTLSLLTAPSSEAAIPNAPARGPEWWRLTAAAMAQARMAPSAGGDLSSAVAARQREHAEQSVSANAQGGGQNRVISGIPSPQGPIDEERRQRGGVFAITRMAYDDAEFLFFGWNDDEDPPPTQAVQVRLGTNRDMRIAVVRQMIVLIREHEHGNFQWQSQRLRRVVELSARPEDSVGLEAFLLREFFETGESVGAR